MKTGTPSRIIPTKLYSTAELAGYLQIHRRTLETWRRLGTHPKLKWKRVGDRRIRYYGADILRFLGDNTTQPRRKSRGVR